MGRVARYKKVKSVDPFAKTSSWSSDVGDTACASLRRTKRRSKTAMKMKEQKASKSQRRGGKKDGINNDKKSGGSNGFGESGYDLPPEGEDEFDMADLMGSVKKQSAKPVLLVDPRKQVSTVSSVASNTNNEGEEEKWTRKLEKVDTRGVVKGSSNEAHDFTTNTAASTTSKKKGKKNKTAPKPKNSTGVTAKTPTRDIIAACSNPNALKTKRKQSIAAPIIARNNIDDQVERPPIFSTLPRGAAKLRKKEAKSDASGDVEDSEDKDARIRKEQQALEAMREKVMRQYAVLRENRRR
eukprot:g12610.t1 g12610   contig6:2265857-2266898(-)